MAFSIFYKHQSKAGRVLAIFFLFASLYIATAAPITINTQGKGVSPCFRTPR